MTPSEFREDLGIHKSRMTGLSCGEEIMTRRSAVLNDTVPACDGRTDGQTDGQTDGRPDYIYITCFSITDARKNLYTG